MEFESGLSRPRIIELLDEFAQANKAYYQNGIIWVRKMLDYQLPGKVSPKADRAHLTKNLPVYPIAN